MIDWDKMVNNALSTLVAAIVLGAAALIWREATSVDQKINDATETLKAQAEYMNEAVEILQKELVDLRRRDKELTTILNRLAREEKWKVHNADGSKEDPLVEEPEVPENNYIQQMLPAIPRFPTKAR